MKAASVSALAVFIKVVLPSLVTALVTTLSLVNPEAIRAICGLQ